MQDPERGFFIGEIMFEREEVTERLVAIARGGKILFEREQAAGLVEPNCVDCGTGELPLHRINEVERQGVLGVRLRVFKKCKPCLTEYGYAPANDGDIIER